MSKIFFYLLVLWIISQDFNLSPCIFLPRTRSARNCCCFSVDYELSGKKFHQRRILSISQNIFDLRDDSAAHIQRRLWQIKAKTQRNASEWVFCHFLPLTYGSHSYFWPLNEWLLNSLHCCARKSTSGFGQSLKWEEEKRKLELLRQFIPVLMHNRKFYFN